ncbi:hypothetical protein C8J57DRAFT_1472211 [Mycena rebaudengoi]|nr:hypothetical protein C8J57DRAFT_1472211 [Mycena rebaudengoi]
MISYPNVSVAKQADNINGFASTVTYWEAPQQVPQGSCGVTAREIDDSFNSDEYLALRELLARQLEDYSYYAFEPARIETELMVGAMSAIDPNGGGPCHGRTQGVDPTDPNYARSRAIQFAALMNAANPSGDYHTLYGVYDNARAFTDAEDPMLSANLGGNRRNWFRITSAAYARLCTGRLYLIVEEQPREIWHDSIWVTHEYPAVIATGTVTQIIEIRPSESQPQIQRVALQVCFTYLCNRRQNEEHAHRITRECIASNKRAHLDAAHCIDPAREECQCSREHGTVRHGPESAAPPHRKHRRAARERLAATRTVQAAFDTRHRLRCERWHFHASVREAESAMEAKHVRGRIGMPEHRGAPAQCDSVCTRYGIRVGYLRVAGGGAPCGLRSSMLVVTRGSRTSSAIAFLYLGATLERNASTASSDRKKADYCASGGAKELRLGRMAMPLERGWEVCDTATRWERIHGVSYGIEGEGGRSDNPSRREPWAGRGRSDHGEREAMWRLWSASLTVVREVLVAQREAGPTPLGHLGHSAMRLRRLQTRARPTSGGWSAESRMSNGCIGGWRRR